MPPSTKKALAVVIIIAFVLMIVMNYLANALPLNGKTTGELSDLYPNLFTPAGVTFSIWGLIYLFLLVFTIYQARVLFGSDHQQGPAVSAIAPTVIVNFLFNASWIYVWHHQMVGLSVLIILGMLITLIIIHEKLQLAYSFRDRRKFALDVPFSLYLGWISVATIANTTAFLVNAGIQPLGLDDLTWTIIMISTAVLVGLLMIFRRSNYLFALVVMWALFGISLRHSQSSEAGYTIMLTCYAGIGLVAVASVVKFVSAKTLTASSHLKTTQ